jgi:hypothetical protein
MFVTSFSAVSHALHTAHKSDLFRTRLLNVCSGYSSSTHVVVAATRVPRLETKQAKDGIGIAYMGIQGLQGPNSLFGGRSGTLVKRAPYVGSATDVE